MFVKLPKNRVTRFAKSALLLHLCILTFLSTSNGQAQENPRRDIGSPTELEPTDPEIRQLLAQINSACSPFSMEDRVEIIQKALKLADTRGLVGDRAVAEAVLASAYIGQAQTDLAFNTFRRALQDAVDSKNSVLEADILISLATEAQLKGNIPESTELVSKALGLSEKSGNLFLKARALGEIGRLKLFAGKLDEAGRAIDEALQIDRLNGYRFESLHLLYRGYYLGLTEKTDQAIDSLSLARARAVAVRDAYSFVMAENAYAFGLVQKGKPDEAIADLDLVRQGRLQKFISDDGIRTCMESAIQLPVFHIAVLEGLTNVLQAAKEKEKELDVWQELYSYSQDHNFLGGEAEAAQKIGDLDNQLKKTDDALKYYALAADLFRKLQNDSLLAQVQVSESLLLIQVGRPKEAFPLEEEVASYAKSHNLRSAEFTAYGVLAEIYQPNGDLDHARDALEKALSLVRPGPFDEEIENRFVLEDYLRLADVYRALKNPTRELIAIDSGYFVAVHLKDEKVQGNLINYLDQRLKDLGIRELLGLKQKEDHLADSLIYSYVLHIRDGFPPNPADDSNWQRILTLPFQIASEPGGATALVGILGHVFVNLIWPLLIV